MDVPTLRRFASAVALGAAGAGITWAGTMEQDFQSLSWGLIGTGMVTGVAALALLRRSILAQVLARGVAWVVFLPAADEVFSSAVSGRLPAWSAAALAGTAGAALLLARSNLETPEARREFAPVRYRNVFLAGAVASAAAGVVTAAASLESMLGGGLPRPWLAVLCAAMFATTVGVVRMRAWGVLLGMVTGVGMLVATLAHLHDFTAVAWALGAVPGLLLSLPLLLSRLQLEPAPSLPHPARVATTDAAAARPNPTLRVRVADLPVEDEVDAPNAAAGEARLS